MLWQDEEARGGKTCSLVENVACVYTLSLDVSFHHNKNSASPGEEELGLFSSTANHAPTHAPFYPTHLNTPSWSAST